MDRSELDLAKITQQLLALSVQAAASFDQAQRKLDLARVVDAQRLTSSEGIARSRSTVVEAAALTAQHKEVFANFMKGAAGKLVAAASQLPQDRRQGFIDGVMRSINVNLAAQASFYAGRERWIAAAGQILSLAEQHQGELWLEEGQLVFASNALLEQVQQLAAQMDEVHHAEVALLQERQAHIAAALNRGGQPV